MEGFGNTLYQIFVIVVVILSWLLPATPSVVVANHNESSAYTFYIRPKGRAEAKNGLSILFSSMPIQLPGASA